MEGARGKGVEARLSQPADADNAAAGCGTASDRKRPYRDTHSSNGNDDCMPQPPIHGDGCAGRGKRRRATAPPREPPRALAREQQEVVDECLKGRNVFFTGRAGTGEED